MDGLMDVSPRPNDQRSTTDNKPTKRTDPEAELTQCHLNVSEVLGLRSRRTALDSQLLQFVRPAPFTYVALVRLLVAVPTLVGVL
jgi:hypothetical protein